MRYTRVAAWLHWLIAALILITIPLILFGGSGKTALHDTATNAHKLVGITILLLTALPETMTRTLRTAAKAVHILFYILLLAMPLSGWWMTSAFPKRHPIEAGLFDIPFLPVPVNIASAGGAHEVHEIGAWLMIALVILHIAAAFKHQFINRDDILPRMARR